MDRQPRNAGIADDRDKEKDSAEGGDGQMRETRENKYITGL